MTDQLSTWVPWGSSGVGIRVETDGQPAIMGTAVVEGDDGPRAAVRGGGLAQVLRTHLTLVRLARGAAGAVYLGAPMDWALTAFWAAAEAEIEALGLVLKRGEGLWPEALVGQPFSFQPIGWSQGVTFSAGGLPPGLSLDPDTGVISGIPAAPGSYPVTVGAAYRGGVSHRVVPIGVTP